MERHRWFFSDALSAWEDVAGSARVAQVVDECRAMFCESRPNVSIAVLLYAWSTDEGSMVRSPSSWPEGMQKMPDEHIHLAWEWLASLGSTVWVAMMRVRVFGASPLSMRTGGGHHGVSLCSLGLVMCSTCSRTARNAIFLWHHRSKNRLDRSFQALDETISRWVRHYRAAFRRLTSMPAAVACCFQVSDDNLTSYTRVSRRTWLKVVPWIRGCALVAQNGMSWGEEHVTAPMGVAQLSPRESSHNADCPLGRDPRIYGAALIMCIKYSQRQCFCLPQCACLCSLHLSLDDPWRLEASTPFTGPLSWSTTTAGPRFSGPRILTTSVGLPLPGPRVLTTSTGLPS